MSVVQALVSSDVRSNVELELLQWNLEIDSGCCDQLAPNNIYTVRILLETNIQHDVPHLCGRSSTLIHPQSIICLKNDNVIPYNRLKYVVKLSP